MNICIHAFIHSTVWSTCDTSGTVVCMKHKDKRKSWEMVGSTQHGKSMPDGAANKNKGKGTGRHISGVVVIHGDRQMGYKEQRNEKRQ